MRGHREAFGSRRIFLLTVAATVAATVPIAFSAAQSTPIRAQSQPAAFDPSGFKFEVASIKPTKTPDAGWYLNSTADGIAGRNVPLDYLVHSAFGIYEDFRWSGAPKWMSSDCYDVEAKMESSVSEQFRQLPRAHRILAGNHMLQLLLEERFNLQVHHDTKELPVYFLVIAKNGLKLQESKPSPNDKHSENGSWGGGGLRDGVTTVTATYVPIEQLASQLTNIVHRKVLDNTGLTGRFDLTLRYTPEYIALQSPSAGAPEGQQVPASVSIFTAVQEQLGLKLESGKSLVEIIVIDHIEKPSGN